MKFLNLIEHLDRQMLKFFESCPALSQDQGFHRLDNCADIYEMGEKRFFAQVRYVAREAPVPSYELDQDAWAAAIQKLLKQPILR